MDLQYNAFISYRHHPDDIRAATDIHRRLERFRVPKALREQGKDITRLFRDKDELPITSSLSEDITRALEHAEYLIVVCSTHTKESVWVQREIETFLQTHDRSKVLTVLIDGQPNEVTPEILLYEDVTDPVTGLVTRKEIEPLFCDWRMSRKQILHEELPRLAAALLNCGYDELRQRQRQYRIRRMIALFSAALMVTLGFMTYFLQTSIRIRQANEDLLAANQKITAANEEIRQANVQIQEHLNQALQNQSKFLASSAQERMDAGDRLTAISLALAALPGENADRPYVPAAEHALSDALSSYVAEEKILSAGIFRAGALVENFAVTEDGNTIYIQDARNIITIWDTFTFQKTGTIDLSVNYIKDMVTTATGNVLISTSNYGTDMHCYNKEGVLLWEKEHTLDMALQNDGSAVAVMQYVDYQMDQILFLDPETGENLRDSIELPDTELNLNISGFVQKTYDPELPLILRGVGSNEYTLHLLDTQTGQLRQLMSSPNEAMSRGEILYASYNQDGNVLVLIDDGRGDMNGTYGETTLYSPEGGIIRCYNRKNGKLLWESEITTYLFNNLQVMEQIPDTNHILCMVGNTFKILNGSTGKEIAACMLPDKPIEINIEADKAWGIQENGDYFAYIYEDNSCTTTGIVDEQISIADVNQGVYALSKLASSVTVYRNASDNTGVPFDGGDTSYIWGSLTYDHLLAVSTYDGVILNDMAENKILWVCTECDNNRPQIMGFSSDGTALWLWNKYAEELLKISVQTGTSEKIPVSKAVDGYNTYHDSPMFYSGDSLYFLVEATDFLGLYQYDTVTQTRTQWLLTELAGQIDYSKSSAVLGVSTDYVWFWRNTGDVYELNRADGTIRTVMTGGETQPRFLLSDGEDRVVFASGSQVLCIAPGGEKLLEFSLTDKKAVSMYFYRDELLILCDDGDIYRYDQTGTFQTKIEQHLYNTFYNSAASVSWEDPLAVSWHETADGDLLVNSFKAGNIIDTEQWETRGFIPYFVTYYEAQNKVINRFNDTLLAYPLYSTQEQIQRAKEILGGYELSDEQKASYGLN